MRDHQHAAHDSYVVGAVAAESEQLLELVRRVQTCVQKFRTSDGIRMRV